MDFGFSEEQDLLRESCRQFLSQEVPFSRVRELAEAERFDRALWAEIAGLGWTGLTIPEAHDGLGLGLVDLLVLAEEHGHLCQPGPFLSTALVATVLSEMGSGDQRARWLPAIGGGDCVATWAHYEPGGGWGAEDVGLEATPAGDALSVSGSKRLVVDALDADLLLVSVRRADGPALVLVPADASGLRLTPHRGLDLARALGEVEFDGVAVPADATLPLADGAAGIERALQIAVVLQCGESLGVAETLLEMTVEYAKVREQFGRPIGSFQAIRHRCADMRVALDGIRTATRYAALAVDQRFENAAEAVHVAKSHTGDSATFIAGEALQIHGGIGFTWEHDLHLYLRRAKSNQVLYGDPAWHNERIARAMSHQRAGNASAG
jgi:alkylation response protein AidB-like acyl-CoA dehydrogenase